MSALILFGGGGDLALRMLLPSLYFLDHDGLLDPDLKIIAAARSDETRDAYIERVRASVAPRAKSDDVWSDETWTRLAARLDYVALDATSADELKALKAKAGDGSVTAFMAVSPSLYGRIVPAMHAAGLAGPDTRIVLEKPVGRDLESFREIDDAVSAVFDERQVFRIDHYLGKETVQNLMALRFANMMFEPLWNANHIDHVQITISETVGLEGRHGFYDETGALRDMVQNHMLQLLALIAMEPPVDYDAASVRDEKVKVLRSLRPVSPEEMVRGQYGSGAVQGEAVEGYADDLGEASDTETFVAIKAHVDSWRWQGVPFYLRTGKRMTERRSEIVIQFKCVPHNIFAGRGGRLDANRLVIRLQPEEYVRLMVMAKQPSMDREGVTLREVPLDLSLTHAFAKARRRIAYERLLLDLIDGDPTLFVRRDEVEAQWRWVDGIRAIWAKEDAPPKRYGAGSWGPSAAIALTERDGVTWHE